MTHPIDPICDHRIDYEVIVDCYDVYEQNMGWHCYFEEGLPFPVSATAELRERNGTKTLCAVEIVSITSREDRPLSLSVCEKGSNRITNISPEDIRSVAVENEEQLNVFNDWCYFHGFPLIEGVL
jgi:Calcium binding